jgi:hypothetical protein
MANTGLGQRRNGHDEPAIVTAGSDLEGLVPFLADPHQPCTAADVVSYVLGTRCTAERRAEI